jgi:hypothetical protein
MTASYGGDVGAAAGSVEVVDGSDSSHIAPDWDVPLAGVIK